MVESNIILPTWLFTVESYLRNYGQISLSESPKEINGDNTVIEGLIE